MCTPMQPRWLHLLMKGDIMAMSTKAVNSSGELGLTTVLTHRCSQISTLICSKSVKKSNTITRHAQ